MNTRATAIIEQARQLTREEQEELLRRLEAELGEGEEGVTPEEIESAWAEEIERRIAKADRGVTVAVEFDQAIEKARRLIRRP